MEWKVANALSRDVERQHLNKILKDIRLTIDSKQGSDIPDSRIRAIVAQMLPAPARPRSFTLSLAGDVEGSAVLGGSDTTLNTTLSVDVIEEAPNTGQAYWRRHGYWELVPESVYAIADVDDSGFIITSLDTGEVFSRIIEGREGEVTVENGDGVDDNPVIGLADLTNTGEGEGGVKLYTRDAKGRIEGDEDADTDNLPEGSTNLYFTEQRARDAAVADEIDPLVIDVAPSQRAVAEALDGIDLSGYAELAGDNEFTGSENRFEGTVWLSGGVVVEDLSASLGAAFFNIGTDEEEATIGLSGGGGPFAPTASSMVMGPAAEGISFNAVGAFGFNASSQGGMLFQSVDLCLFNSASDDVVFNGVSVRPNADNGSLLGSASHRWSEVFAVNGTINTSDARHKTVPRDMTNEEIACAADIARLPCVFQWLAAIEDKGEDARLHIGPTVQAVITSMESHGLNPMRYGFVCYDEWEAQEEKTVRRFSPEEGFVDEVLQEVLPAGDVYSLRPTELAFFVMRGLAHRQDELERRLAALEG